MGICAKVFDPHSHLTVRAFRAAMPTPCSSAMPHKTLPQSDRLPGKPKPPCAALFWKRCVQFPAGTRMSIQDLVGEAPQSDHRRNKA